MENEQKLELPKYPEINNIKITHNVISELLKFKSSKKEERILFFKRNKRRINNIFNNSFFFRKSK